MKVLLFILLFAFTALGQISPSGATPRWSSVTPGSCNPAARSQALLYNWTEAKLYKCVAGAYAALADPGASFGTISTNQIPYYSAADTLSGTGYTWSATDNALIQPANGMENIRNSNYAVFLNTIDTTRFQYSTAAAAPANKAFIPFGLEALYVTSAGSGANFNYGGGNRQLHLQYANSVSTDAMRFTMSCWNSSCSGTLQGVLAQASCSGSTCGTMTGIQGRGFGNTASSNQLTGVLGDLQISLGAGTHAIGSALKAGYWGHGSSGQTITSLRGLDMSGWTKGGSTITTSYGIYMDTSIDVGTTKWALYSLSTSPSLVSGNFTVGGTGKFYISTSQTPATASDTCTAGQIVWDASYIYVCTATDTWRRAAISGGW